MHAALQSVRPLAVVIDDDPGAAEALALTLQDWGADVVSGACASEVLTLVRGARVSWVITDFELGPHANGVSDIAPLLAAAPAARVLVLSGAPLDQARRAAAGAGFDYMSKPATAEAIGAWLERG